MGRRSKIVIVVYYTEQYRQEINRLLASLSQVGLKACTCLVPDLGAWRKNCHRRPQFLLAMRKRFPDQALLSLDADAIVHEDPTPHLEAFKDVDFACHKFTDGWLPGTLLLNPTPATDRMLGLWQTYSVKDEHLANRFAFRKALTDAKAKVGDMPPALCWIFDLSASKYGEVQPIIEHLQASREFSGRDNTRLLRSRKNRLHQLENANGI